MAHWMVRFFGYFSNPFNFPYIFSLFSLLLLWISTTINRTINRLFDEIHKQESYTCLHKSGKKAKQSKRTVFRQFLQKIENKILEKDKREHPVSAYIPLHTRQSMHSEKIKLLSISKGNNVVWFCQYLNWLRFKCWMENCCCCVTIQVEIGSKFSRRI